MSKRSLPDSLAPAVASAFVALLATAPLSAQNENKGSGTCKYTQTTGSYTTYSTSAWKVAYTVFGLLGSTQKCKEHTYNYTTYTYTGPPLKKVVIRPTGMGPHESVAGPGLGGGGGVGPGVGPGVGRPIVSAAIQYDLRMLDAASDCYGDPAAPDLDAVTERVRFVGLDGVVKDLPYQSVTGSLNWFLGNGGYDPADFDPNYLSSSSWTGHVATIDESMLVQPTLIWLAGGDDDVPVQAMMDLDAPDMKVLQADLGAQAAGATLVVVVSGTAPGDGSLLVVDGITVPIVPDAYTTAFAQLYPGIGGTADANGMADIGFPPVTLPSLEGLDLHVAVIAFDTQTGLAIDATTFTQLQLRDLDVCQ